MGENIKNTYGTQVISSEEKVTMVYIMLQHKQRVNYDIVFEKFGCSERTFKRIIATIRELIEIVIPLPNTYLVFNKTRNSYELIQTSLETNKLSINWLLFRAQKYTTTEKSVVFDCNKKIWYNITIFIEVGD